MKLPYYFRLAAILPAMLVATSCEDLLNEDPENKAFEAETDYTITSNMIQPLIGAYAEFYIRGWEDFPLISVRGDDVNHGGLGDQQDYAEADKYNYNKDFWMFNSVWQNLYKDILTAQSTMEQIERYKEHAANKAVADQYIAEAKTIKAFLLFQLTRLWGDVFIPATSDPTDMLISEVSKREDVLRHISDQMDEAAELLPNLRPNERTDVPGGVTRYTALAIKALANLDLKDYQAVADATSEIIASGKFTLDTDFYNLFKLKGKLNNENLFEWQYSDFGQGAGDQKKYEFDFFAPQSWTPKVAGATSGWGFYEPSIKWIKFMLDRNEDVRLQTSVLFTNRGIAEIKMDPAYTDLPDWVNNVTPSGDQINDYQRALFASGKHYLPSDQLIPGRTKYSSNKNFTLIRYAEVLLMHAEALTQGASSATMTADAALNLVRERADLDPLSNVTIQQVMDEKFAELAMEWGTRYYDMVRLGEFDELSYEGRSFTSDKIFLPYPQAQIDQLPVLRDHERNL